MGDKMKLTDLLKGVETQKIIEEIYNYLSTDIVFLK